MDLDEASAFPRNERFELLGELGRGGMGVVYEVLDRDRRVRLALKALRRVGGREILRLKSEFRALRDLHHPNLVRLGELFEHEGTWFFTMEKIEGVDFLRGVRTAHREAPPPSRPPDETATAATRGDGVAARPLVASVGSAADLTIQDGRVPRWTALIPEQPSPLRGFDEAKLRAALRGLVTGVAALHRAGMIHRDIKPSNILVEPGGRVVLLDFGVVEDHGARRADPEPALREIVGTFAYMAPEQAAGGEIGYATDWYAVGVVLFQALTGQVPFSGKDGLQAKIAVDAPSPRQIVADLPDDLAGLCERLLRRDPAARPGEAELLDFFGIRPDQLQDSDPGGTGPGGVFVGRDAELEALGAAFDATVAARAARAVFITGESGIGKSALARRFLEQLLDRRPDVLVLASRCDEREIVSYNALDGAIDTLARYLGRVPAAELAAPGGARQLLRLFPVLRDVAPLAGAARRAVTAGPIDPRTLAFSALVELLGFVARRRPVVMLVDDVHWADIDSLALFGELFGGADTPPVLLIATGRTGEVPLAARGVVRVPIQELRLGGLEGSDAAALVVAAAAVTPSAVDAHRLTAEAGGHPMFLAELARRLDRGGDATVRLDDALWQRIGELAGGARALLEHVCLAGAPLALGGLAAAAELGAEAFAGELAALRGARLVRLTGTRDADTVEPYHDRVRETVAGRIEGPRRREIHRALAWSLEARGGSVELLAHHLAGAGEHVRAAGFAEAAARRAIASLAFDRAAEWLRLALAFGDPASPRRRQLLGERADMLARAGRTADAATTFLEAAAASADADDARELRRRAAEELLIGGHLARGVELSKQLLDELGLGLPATTAGAVARLGWYRMRLGASRLGYRRRPAADVPVRAAQRVDLAWTVASGLSMVDSMRGAVLALQSPLLAMRTGDPARIARAACGGAMAAAGVGGDRLARRLRDLAHRAAGEIDAPEAAQYAAFSDVAILFFVDNDWREVVTGCERAAALGNAAERGHTFEADVIEQVHLWALNVLGEITEVRRRVPPAIRAAQRIGNRFVEIALRTFFPIVELVADRPAEARADVEDAIASWQDDPHAVTNPFFFALKGRTQCALYTGELDDPGLDADWERLSRSLLFRVPLIRLESAQWMGQLAIARAAAARAGGDAATCELHAAIAAGWIARMRRSPLPARAPLCLQLDAALACAAGDRDRAAVLLTQALASLDTFGHRAAAAATRWRLGQTLAGTLATDHRIAAERFFAAHAVRRPDRLVETQLPGSP